MKKTKKQITLFLVLTFVLSWAFMLGVIIPAVFKSVANPDDTALKVASMALMAVVMSFPTIGVVLTRLITRDWTDLKLHLHLKGNATPYLLGWFGPLVLTIVGTALYFALFPGQFTTATFLQQPWGVLLVLVAPLLNAVNCFGEEWGWRGFLYPKIREGRSFTRAAILVGLIWGIWHAPIIAVGHNYGKIVGTDPWWMVALAIAAMCLFCVVLSLLFSYITEKADSVWPAVLAHGCVNGCAGLGILFLTAPDVANTFVGPTPVGIVGAIPFIIAAIWITLRKKNSVL